MIIDNQVIRYNFRIFENEIKAIKFLQENKINVSHLLRESAKKEARKLRKFKEKYPEGF